MNSIALTFIELKCFRMAKCGKVLQRSPVWSKEVIGNQIQKPLLSLTDTNYNWLLLRLAQKKIRTGNTPNMCQEHNAFSVDTESVLLIAELAEKGCVSWTHLSRYQIPSYPAPEFPQPV